MAATKLVIVESPAKAKTIENYLGSDYKVMASVGHIRDLPSPSELPADMKKGPYGRFAVNVEGNFDPYYIVPANSKKTVTELKRALKECNELYLATDEDREGEAIAWHLLEVLKPKVPVKRMVFHEITKEAIQRAIDNTRDVDANLVDAQETRRILDRLFGYELSRLLWSKVRGGLSAGRVQSVATRMIVDRERERMAFVPAKYWDIAVNLQAVKNESDTDTVFEARLTEIDGTRIATGRDFDDRGQLKNHVTVLDKETTLKLGEALTTHSDFRVATLETKPYKRRPAAPFTTSTLQQEASRKLRLSSRETMSLAQSLYENGYISYMRTDSTALSEQALNAARKQASELYGTNSVPDKPRYYATKSKGAQEAHEAIRPTGDTFRTPKELENRLTPRELKLYDLIWKRTLASQMTDATGSTASVRINTAPTVDGKPRELVFSASGTVITHKGFLAAYEESRDAERYETVAGEGNRNLPDLVEGQALNCIEVEYLNREHATTAPPRFTEASLVKAMEERSIGRPSTYASIINTIISRGYVQRSGQALVPSWVAFAVTRLLEDNLGQLVDYDFTASMEADLDRIAEGKQNRVQWLKGFYFGDGDDTPQLPAGADPRSRDAATKSATQKANVDRVALRPLLDSLGDIDARAINSIPIAPGITLRVGMKSEYLEDAAGNRAAVPEGVSPEELTLDMAKELFERAANNGRILGQNPDTGNDIAVLVGRFGPYVQEVIPEEPQDEGTKPKKRTTKVKAPTASLFKSMDPETVTLEQALQLLSLPRTVGLDPESGATIVAANGRYGPYLSKEGAGAKDTRSLTSEEQLLTVTLEEALALFAQPKPGRGRSSKEPLAELGNDPVTDKPVRILDGRFGPYITDGTTNVTVPRGRTIDEITAELAYEMLAEKRAKGPAKKRTTTRKPATKKATTSKTTTVKKTATKKS